MAARAKKMEVPAVDVLSVLESAEKAREDKTSKSKVPTVEVSAKIKAVATKYRQLRDQETSIKSEIEILGNELIEATEKDREEICKQEYHPSIRVPDSQGLSVMLTWRHAYSKISMEHKDALAGAVGADYFKTHVEIQVKDVSEENLKELIGLVSPEKFAQFFSVERWLSPTERYTQDQFTFARDKREKLSGLVRQYKPAIKVR